MVADVHMVPAILSASPWTAAAMLLCMWCSIQIPLSLRVALPLGDLFFWMFISGGCWQNYPVRFASLQGILNAVLVKLAPPGPKQGWATGH